MLDQHAQAVDGARAKAAGQGHERRFMAVDHLVGQRIVSKTLWHQWQIAIAQTRAGGVDQQVPAALDLLEAAAVHARVSEMRRQSGSPVAVAIGDEQRLRLFS